MSGAPPTTTCPSKARGDAAPNAAPGGVPIVVDTREQTPYAFDSSRVRVVRRALPAGDYSLDGHEGRVAVERKSLEDYVSTVVRARARFAKELRVLAEYELGCVVVEGNVEDVLAHRYRSGAHPNSVFGATLSIIIDYRVPVYFCGDRQLSCRFVEGLLCRYHQGPRPRPRPEGAR
jgi:DNA excision repair protein ERCC-4